MNFSIVSAKILEIKGKCEGFFASATGLMWLYFSYEWAKYPKNRSFSDEFLFISI